MRWTGRSDYPQWVMSVLHRIIREPFDTPKLLEMMRSMVAAGDGAFKQAFEGA